MVRELSAEDKAGCLRLFLRRLPDPLFLHCQRAVLVDLAGISFHNCSVLNIIIVASVDQENVSEERKNDVLKALQILAYFIPEVSKQCLRKLLGHLNAIVAHSTKNKMGIENLAIMFAAYIFPILEVNFFHFTYIFEGERYRTMIQWRL